MSLNESKSRTKATGSQTKTRRSNRIYQALTAAASPGIYTSSISLLQLPNEIIEVILLEASGSQFFTDWRRDARSYIEKMHFLSTTCRRFREILLPRIYRNVSLTRSNHKSHLQFLRLMSTYGHFCQKLALRISAKGTTFCDLVGLLRKHCDHLKNLQLLDLDVRLRGDEFPPEKENTVWDSFFMHVPSTMGSKELRHWKSLWAALPGVTEFHLRGLPWPYAAAAFSYGEMPTVRTLGLHLAGSTCEKSLSTGHALHSAFPGLVNITFPACWCPDPALIRAAFADRQLESIRTTCTAWDRYGHRCLPCNWAISFALLLDLSAASLTSLKIASDICLKLPRERTALPCLTSLTLDDINFGVNEEVFSNIMEPFFSSPLQYLGVENCKMLPESFSTWFEPKLQRWPALKTLSLNSMITVLRPDHDRWERISAEAMMPSGFSVWTSHAQIALEGYCEQRDIQFTSNWYTIQYDILEDYGTP